MLSSLHGCMWTFMVESVTDGGLRGARCTYRRREAHCSAEKPFIKLALLFHRKNANESQTSMFSFVFLKSSLVLPF